MPKMTETQRTVAQETERYLRTGESDPYRSAWSGGFLQRDASMPVVLFGPGSIVNQAHRPDEFVPLDETLIAARAYALLAVRALDGGDD